MSLLWLWMLVASALVGAFAERGGSSLRGALEALQRRQRGRMHGPMAPPPDYEALYEYLPQPYADTDYPGIDEEEIPVEEEPRIKYVIKFLDPKENERPISDYEYRIVKKSSKGEGSKQESAFRERSHHSDNDRLRELFMDPEDHEDKGNGLQDRTGGDAEYALLLSQLWTKYKHNKHTNNPESAPQGVVKLYKEKIVKKRYPDNWGPIAFKRKRSSGSEIDHPIIPEYDRKSVNSNGYQPDNDDDLREEYAIALQPLDDNSFQDLNNDEQYAYETVEKRFPVAKRSSGSFDYGRNIQKKRSTQEYKKRDTLKNYRSSSGTDPKLLKDLSKIFGEPNEERLKNPVKRSSDHDETSQEPYKPPQVTVLTHNESHHDHHHDHDHTKAPEEGTHDSHEQHGHMHHPGMFGKETDHPISHDHEQNTEKPITVRKKSIDWSDYFGIDKRKKKSNTFVSNLNQDNLRKQYFDTFNKEVIFPLSTSRQNDKVKRNYMQDKSNQEAEIQNENRQIVATKTEDRTQMPEQNANSKLENIDKKLKNMEGLIVDEALHYSNVGEELDSKEEQEMKEKLLSKLAAAYSLEKMRKALKEFKQSLQIHKNEPTSLQSSSIPVEEAKSKRVAVKKEKVIPELGNDMPLFSKEDDKNGDFEEEQGAGHYLNGRVEEQFSEGYMGGSGRHEIPFAPTGIATGSCPVLAKIVQRCRGVDLLAGDRGQIFLPLCSLHQICYLCGEAPPTTCDLVFLSEADTACDGSMSCQRAARAALMTLRDLHDNLADELDGECEASPCLPATLKLNLNWQRALQR